VGVRLTLPVPNCWRTTKLPWLPPSFSTREAMNSGLSTCSSHCVCVCVCVVGVLACCWKEQSGVGACWWDMCVCLGGTSLGFRSRLQLFVWKTAYSVFELLWKGERGRVCLLKSLKTDHSYSWCHMLNPHGMQLHKHKESFLPDKDSNWGGVAFNLCHINTPFWNPAPPAAAFSPRRGYMHRWVEPRLRLDCDV